MVSEFVGSGSLKPHVAKYFEVLCSINYDCHGMSTIPTADFTNLRINVPSHESVCVVSIF